MTFRFFENHYRYHALETESPGPSKASNERRNGVPQLLGYHALETESKQTLPSGGELSRRVPRPLQSHACPHCLQVLCQSTKAIQSSQSIADPASVSSSPFDSVLQKMRLQLIQSQEPPGHISVVSGCKTNVSVDSSPSKRLEEMRDQLIILLINKYGLQRARTLYEKHVERCHYLLINAEEDDEVATTIGKLLKDSSDCLTIKSRRNVALGSQRLEVWQRLMQSATTVLVFLSRAFCKDDILSLTFPSVLTQSHRIVPLFLEKFSPREIERDFHSNLRPVVYSYGKTLYDRSDDEIKDYVYSLHAKFNFIKHLSAEVNDLENLLLSTDSQNICHCGEC